MFIVDFLEKFDGLGEKKENGVREGRRKEEEHFSEIEMRGKNEGKEGKLVYIYMWQNYLLVLSKRFSSDMVN